MNAAGQTFPLSYSDCNGQPLHRAAVVKPVKVNAETQGEMPASFAVLDRAGLGVAANETKLEKTKAVDGSFTFASPFPSHLSG